jgi:UDP-N-acetyl-D-mannosaminuronic acid dehydrogenase
VTDVCVHGLGYIGLPAAAVLADHGFDVVGFDVDDSIVRTLREGDVHIEEPGLGALVEEGVSSGALIVTDEAVPADVHIICVPTPFDRETKSAELDYVEAAASTVAGVLRKGDLVVLESTVPPGTTRTTLRPLLEESGLEAGVDFSVAYSPETVLPGDVLTELRGNDRIVGGIDGESAARAADLYDSFVEGEIHETEDATTAEFVKLIQNTFRDTNVALANEIAMIAHDYGIDSREAIKLANRHPRVDIHHPGPGVGGHCLPIDPWFLGQDSDRLDLVERARDINDGMVEYVIDWLDEDPGLDGTSVAVLGVAYKGGVGDTRMSPGLDLARELQATSTARTRPATADGGHDPSTVDVRIHDPYVTDQTLDLSSLEEALSGADALVLTANHPEFESIDPERARELMDGTVVVDTFAHLPAEAWRATGFDVRSI